MTANTNRADLRRRPRIFIPEHPVITDVNRDRKSVV